MPSAARPFVFPFALPTYVGPATGDPTPPVPSHRPALALSARTAVEATSSALGDAVADLGAELRAAHEVQAVDRWAPLIGPTRSRYAAEREPRWAERDDDAADEVVGDVTARAAVYAAAGAYARALRTEGSHLAATLAAVRARVQTAAGPVRPPALAAVQRAAAARCLEAYDAR